MKNILHRERERERNKVLHAAPIWRASRTKHGQMRNSGDKKRSSKVSKCCVFTDFSLFVSWYNLRIVFLVWARKLVYTSHFEASRKENKNWVWSKSKQKPKEKHHGFFLACLNNFVPAKFLLHVMCIVYTVLFGRTCFFPFFWQNGFFVFFPLRI